MTHTELQLLVDYHYWARDRMFAALDALPLDDYARPLGGSFGSIRATVLHTYSAEWIWMERWHGVSPASALDVADLPDVASARAAWHRLEARVREYASGLTGERLTERVDYRNLAGVAANSSRWTMMQHVVNHASYHRGQVTAMVRQVGGAVPASQDLITYYREKGI